MRVFVLLIWLGTLLLFIFKPKSGILFALGVKTLLFNVSLQGVPLYRVPVFQVGDVTVVYTDGFIVALVLFYALKQIKTLLSTFPRLSVTVTPFTFLFLWTGFQTLHGIVLNGASSIRQAESYLIPMLYGFVLPSVLRGKKQIKQTMFKITGIITGVVLLNLLYFYFFGGINSVRLAGDYRRNFRFIGSYQVILAGVGFNVILLLLLSNQIKGKMKSYVILILLALAVFAPQYRSVWLAVVAGTLLIIIKTKRFIKVGGYVFLLLLFILGLIPLASNLAGQQFGQVLARSIEDLVVNRESQANSTWSFRLRIWEEYWPAIRESLVFGRGLGTHVYVLSQGEEKVTIMHNDYLAYMSYFGVIGLGLFVSSIGYWFVSIRRYVRLETDQFYRRLGFALQIIILMYMIFAIYFQFSDWFWIFLALGAALYTQKTKSYTSASC